MNGIGKGGNGMSGEGKGQRDACLVLMGDGDVDMGKLGIKRIRFLPSETPDDDETEKSLLKNSYLTDNIRPAMNRFIILKL